MKILNLSLDSRILKDDSHAQRRILEYSELVNRYDVIVPSEINKKISLSEKIDVYGASGKNKFFQLRNFCKISRSLFKQNNYNVVTVQDQYFLALMGLRLSKKFNSGFEIQVHGFEKYSGIRKIIFKFVIKKADSVRVVSERLKRRLVDEFGIEARKIIIVSINTGIRYKVLGIRENKDGDNFIFLTVGRLVLVKNIEMQIKAVANLQKEYPNIKLLVCGSGEVEKKLKVYSLKLKANVEFLGWQDDIERYYKQADVFMLTSDSEGWGMVVIEAASYGLPIIMTDVGCAREVIKNNQSGLVIPVGDQKSLEEAMMKLIEDNKLREEIGKCAVEAIKRLPSKAETLGRYKESWTKALKNK